MKKSWGWGREFRLEQFIALNDWCHYQNRKCLKGWKLKGKRNESFEFVQFKKCVDVNIVSALGN